MEDFLPQLRYMKLKILAKTRKCQTGVGFLPLVPLLFHAVAVVPVIFFPNWGANCELLCFAITVANVTHLRPMRCWRWDFGIWVLCMMYDPFTHQPQIMNWVVVSFFFYFHPYLGKIPILTFIFFKGVGKNHQLVKQLLLFQHQRFSSKSFDAWRLRAFSARLICYVLSFRLFHDFHG